MRASWDLLAVRKLRRLIATWRPALVHAHDPRSHSLALTALVGRRNNIPLVVTRRLPKTPKGALRFGGRVACFVAISGAVRDALLRGGIPDERIALIYPGVSRPAAVHARDWRAECRWPEESVVAGLVGPLATTEGLATIERIAHALAPATIARLRLVVLGGPAGGKARIGGVAAFRAGFVHDVHNAIAGLDLMLHPGTAEGLGTAVIDGMALAVPSVAFAGGSVAEIVAAGENGLLAAAGDELAFAQSVDRLVADGALRQRLAAAGPLRAQAFAPVHFVEGVIGIYRGLVERSRPGRDSSG